MGPPPPPRPHSTCRPLEQSSRSTASASSCTGPPSASTPTSPGSGEEPALGGSSGLLQRGGGGLAGSQVSTQLPRSAPWGAFPTLDGCGFLRPCWCLTFQVLDIIIQQPYAAACSLPESISTTTTQQAPHPSCPLRPCPISGDHQHVVCLYEFAFVLLCLFPGELLKMPMPGHPLRATWGYAGPQPVGRHLGKAPCTRAETRSQEQAGARNGSLPVLLPASGTCCTTSPSPAPS